MVSDSAHVINYAYLHEPFLFSCESRSTRREPVHGGRTPSAPLSATAVRLLTEFGLRYGIVSNNRV